MDAQDYTPTQIGENDYTLAVRLTQCPTCGELMADDTISSYATFWSQLKRGGLHRHFDYHVIDGKQVCEECWSKYSQESFQCSLCDKSYPKADIKYQYKANGIGYLCRHCYETVTAKEWDEAIRMVYDMHQYSD